MTNQAVMQGDTKKCLGLYGKANGVVAASRELTEFADAVQHTTSQWLRGLSLPKGQKLIAVQHFLEGKGFTVEELQGMQPEVLDIRRLMAYRILQPRELNQVMEYADTEGMQSLFRVLRGETSLIGDKLELARILILEHEADLIKVRPSQQRAPNPTQPEPPPVDRAATKSAKCDPVVVALAAFVRAALPLALQLESDSYNQKDRDYFRTLVGEENFFAFSNVMNRLTGPRARATYRGEEFSHGTS